MARLIPVAAGLVTPDWVDRVPSPAHDALTPDERRAHLERNPDSYLGVARSLDDLPPADRAAGVDVLGLCQDALDRLRAGGAFGPAGSARLWLYRLATADHQQIAVVGGTTVEDAETGAIKVHEQVNRSRTAALADHLRALRVQSSPITLARREDPALDRLISAETERAAPTIAFTSPEGLTQEIWSITDQALVAEISSRFAAHSLYLIDGHHRAAAAADLHRGEASPATNVMLSAVFPAGQLRNRAFHRHLPDVDQQQFLGALDRRFEVVEASVERVRSRSEAELALRLADRWFVVAVPPASGGDEPESFARLDAIRLQRAVLEPLLGIDTAHPAGRIAYVPAIGPAQDPATLPAVSTGAVWLMRPVPVATLLQAADAGLIMPPKSTYFEPKVRSGIFLRNF